MSARWILAAILWMSFSCLRGAEDRFLEWNRLHEKGVQGDKTAVLACIGELEQVLQQEPDNQLARVYLGSAYTLRSRDLWIGPKKLEALKHGGALMDQAVAAAPGNPQVRLVRAMNSFSLPKLFGRRKLALEDLKVLLAQAEAPEMQSSMRQAIYYFAGLAQEKQAVELWTKALAIDPASELAAKIRSALHATRS